MTFKRLGGGRRVLVSLASGVALVALVGCGGDKQSDPMAAATTGGVNAPSASASVSASASAESAGSPASKTTTAASPSASPAASATAKGATPGGGQVTGSGADALKALAKDLSGKTYQVTYAMTITTSTGTTKGNLTLARKPPKSLTMFTITESTDALEAVTLIDDGKTTLSCFGDPTGGGTCIKAKSDGSGSLLGSIVSVAAILGSLEDSVDVTDAGSQAVAGADSRCFNVNEKDGSKGIACFTKKDGLLTLLQGKDETEGSETSLRATNVASSVPDSAFDVPKDYSVTDTTGG